MFKPCRSQAASTRPSRQEDKSTSRSPFVALVVALVMVSAATVIPATPVGSLRSRTSQPSRTYTYSVGTRGAVKGNMDELRVIARETFQDPRGWAAESDLEAPATVRSYRGGQVLGRVLAAIAPVQRSLS